MSTFSLAILRDSFKQLPDIAASSANNTPDLRSIFTPLSHSGALDPKREIVVGDRGVGKSFWSSVLQNDAARAAVSEVYPELRLNQSSVSLAFSETLAAKSHPSSRNIASMNDAGIAPELIWRSVFLAAVPQQHLPGEWSSWEWRERCHWVSRNAEKEEQILSRYNADLSGQGRSHLYIFDALDRLGTDWKSIRALTKSLFSVVLDMRAFPSLQSKIFIRPDMESDREIWSIRDGSKLKQNMVRLSWARKDLYGFVWHWLLLDQDARSDFIALCDEVVRISIARNKGEELIRLPDLLLEDEAIQKRLFEAIAGDMMGAGSKKGHPYTWIPTHLADARGQVSLRSFIIALRDAARNTSSQARTVLTHEKIKLGVTSASFNRIQQLKEDYVWIEDVLRPLKNLLTPNAVEEYINRWREDGTIEKIFDLRSKDPECLIPVELEGSHADDRDSYAKLVSALINTGVAETRKDGRLNVPDLFQVASGMRRKGGASAPV